MKLYLDSETYSETPITHGTYRYIADSELMVVTYAIDDGPVHCVDCTSTAYSFAPLLSAIIAADEIIAHNAMFDRGVVNKHITETPIEKWRCTMARALAHSLPGSLDKLGEILNIRADLAKIKEGKALVQLFCKPRPANNKLRRATSETDTPRWAQFLEYAKADITAMREIDRKLPSWNYTGRELALWHLDQKINDRGFCVDSNLAESAIAAVAREQGRLADRTHTVTNGEVASTTQRDVLLEHILAEYGIALPDMQAATLERRLNDPDVPDSLKELLAIRLQASSTSTTKYKSLTRGTTGGRLRGTAQFCGAGRTGRWAHRGFQPGNLPSRGLLPADEITTGTEAMKSGVAHLCYDNVMLLATSAIRGCIVAPLGRKLVISDLSNIEGRVQAWLAGEEWKLQAFRDFDAGEGPDLYKLAYSKSFRIDANDVTKAQRQIGKVMELMLGYQGRVGAFLTGAATYGFDVEELGVIAYETIPADVLADSEGFYEWSLKKKMNTYGLSKQAFVVCNALATMWRIAHSNIASLWKDLEAICIEAVENPGVTLHCRKLKVRRDGAWLRIILPSGRALCYPHPQVKGGKLTYMGQNQYTRQWCRLSTYGGKLFENCCQAVARDVMAHNLPAIEDAGYETVLTVHDEDVCETPDSPEFNVGHLSDLLASNPPWALDMPLAAGGFETYRYRKE